MSDDYEDVVGSKPTSIRDPKRGAMRAADSLERAAQRAAELRGHLGNDDEGVDEFYISPDDVPDGWTYEWKRKTLLGAEDPAYQVSLLRAGWEPVPTSRHPSYMPMDGNYPVIERKGMILMERPSEIQEEMRARDRRKAGLQVRNKEIQLSQPRAGEFERSNKDQSLVKVSRGYEAIPIPE